MIQTKRPTTLIRLALLALAGLFFMAGCLPLDDDQGAGDSSHTPAAATNAATSEPYYPADFRDILIPGELEWQRDKSISINTESFTGGVLNFSGRVEVNSLTEFFVNGMKKDGWTVIGSVKSADVLLAFVKEQASCLIKIDEGGALGKTEVNIYATHKNNK
jgi:hypothetical protein